VKFTIICPGNELELVATYTHLGAVLYKSVIMLGIARGDVRILNSQWKDGA